MSINNSQVRRTHTCAILVMILLALGLVLDLVGLGSNLAQQSLLRSAASGQTISDAVATANDARQALIGILQVAVFVITAICFLVWIFQAYKSMIALGRPSAEFTPGWAVGYWFIPILNLFRPYQVVRELWANSAALIRSNTGGYEAAEPSALLGFWWAAWIISNLAGRATLQSVTSSTTVDQLISMTQTLMVNDGLSMVSGILAIAVVRGIDNVQLKADQIPVMPAFPPAPWSPYQEVTPTASGPEE